MQWSKCSSAGLVGIAFLVGSSFVYGQTGNETRADQLFNKAVELSEARKYDEACPLLAESNSLDPRPGTLFALADCEREEGKVASSVAHFKEYLTAYEALKGDARKRHDQRATSARGYIKTLEPQIPTLKLSFPGGIPLDFVLTRNGTTVDRIALDTEIPVDPGEQVIVLSVPDHENAEQRVTLALKDKKTVDLVPGGLKGQGEKPVIQEKPRMNPQKTMGIVMLGTGIAGLGFGGVMGSLALSQKNIIKDHCRGLGCDGPGWDAVNQGRQFGELSTIGFAAGGVIAVAGVVLLVTAPKAEPKTGWLKGFGATANRNGAFVGMEGQF